MCLSGALTRVHADNFIQGRHGRTHHALAQAEGPSPSA
jgi:hypothetical protein